MCESFWISRKQLYQGFVYLHIDLPSAARKFGRTTEFRFRSALLVQGVMFLRVPAAKASLDPAKAITQFVHQSWQSEQGLPENSVTSIAQTKDGYLWLSTKGGLARFDVTP